MSGADFSIGDLADVTAPDVLVCPACGLNNNHVVGAFTRMGAYSGEAEHYRGTELGEGEAESRSALVITFACEGCTSGTARGRYKPPFWNLVFQQHKGEERVWREINVRKAGARGTVLTRAHDAAARLRRTR